MLSRSANVEHLYVDSGIPSAIESLREKCSSWEGVQMSILLLEGLALSRGLLVAKVTERGPPISLFGFDFRTSVGPPPSILHVVDTSILGTHDPMVRNIVLRAAALRLLLQPQHSRRPTRRKSSVGFPSSRGPVGVQHCQGDFDSRCLPESLYIWSVRKCLG